MFTSQPARICDFAVVPRDTVLSDPTQRALFHVAHFPTMSAINLRVSKCPSEALAYTNCFIVNPRNFNPHSPYAVLNDNLIINLR